MTYRQPVTIHEFIDLIASHIKRADDEPLDLIGSYIVGALWANTEVDIGDMENDYPELITLADLAAELETLQGADNLKQEIWNKLLESFERLKIQAYKQ